MRVETETYSLKQQNPYLNHADVTRPYAIHGAAWKWLGEEVTRCISVSPNAPFDDGAVVYRLYELVSEADILVGHNLDRFDIRKFNTRAISHGLKPIGQKVTVDTLKLARRYFDFPSNALGYLARHLGLDIKKDESPDWEAIRKGCPEALAYMRMYNKRDVDVTERVYLKLRSWDNNSPNIAKMQNITDVTGKRVVACTGCGSTDTINNGHYWTRRGVKTPKSMCKSCGKTFKRE